MCKHSFRFVKLHTTNYMYSGTQRMIELASFTILHLRLCTIEKVIYKTKLDEYIYFVGLDNPYRLKNRFYSNCYTLTSSNVVMSHFADANFCCVSSDACHRGRHLKSECQDFGTLGT